MRIEKFFVQKIAFQTAIMNTFTYSVVKLFIQESESLVYFLPPLFFFLSLTLRISFKAFIWFGSITGGLGTEAMAVLGMAPMPRPTEWVQEHF